MDSTETKLKNETWKWKDKIDAEINEVKAANAHGRELIDNIRAYSEDSRYFTGKGDLIRAFEAIIWAWAFLEIGKKLGVIVGKDFDTSSKISPVE